MTFMQGIRTFCSNYIKDTTGSIVPVLALLLPVLLGSVGMGVDVSYWMMNKRNLQSAADAAALAAAYQAANGSNDEQSVQAAALREASYNGFDSEDGTLILNIASSGSSSVTYEVMLEQPDTSLFSGLVFEGTTTLRVSAMAESTGSVSQTGDCFVVLGNGSQALLLNSNAEINMTGCNVNVNSTNNTAVMINSNSHIEASSVCIGGDYRANGSGYISPNPTTDCAPMADPYADLEGPDVGNCDYYNNNFNHGTHTISPGVYCGSFNLNSNSTVVMDPGVYIFKTSVNVNSNATLEGENVMMYFTENGRLTLNSNSTLDITPMETGPYAGILLFQDQDYGNGHYHILNSNTNIGYDGLIYFPNATLTMNSNTNIAMNSSCTQIVVGKAILNSNIEIDFTPNYSECDHVTSEITSASVRLIQ